LRVDDLKQLVKLRGDSCEMHVRILADWTVRHCGRLHRSVHAPETERVATSYHRWLVH
jgi:ATP phosphoribosyltransferase